MEKTTTTNNIVNILANTKGATICTIVTETTPKMRKTNNPFIGRVQKLTRTQMQFGYDYERAVNNRLKKEGKEANFSALSRKWGKWLVPNKVAEHNGEIYLRFYTMPSFCEVSYLVDGRLATSEETEAIKSFVQTSSPSARQAEFGLVEHQVEPREYKASAIKMLSLNGETYVIEKEALATIGA